jgi:DNA-binding transcriptional LysR family regulator
MHPVHLSRVDLNLFVIFDAIFTEGGVTPASRRLNLSQPAISHALTRLREMFDDPLFVRRGQAMVPTQRARQMIESVRAALQRLETTFAPNGAFDPSTLATTFVLGLPEPFEATAMPIFLARIAQLAPAVDVVMVKVDRGQMKSELATGSVDAVVDIWRPVSGDLRSAALTVRRFAVVARRGHPAVGPDLDLDTYLAQGHILVSARRKGLGLEDYALHGAGLERRIKVRSRHFFAACHMVAATDYLLTLTEQYATVLSAGTDNQILPFPLDTASSGMHLYWHARTDDDPANAWMRSQLLVAVETFERGARPV